MQKCKIPVFFHIPKNAGTYVLSKTMSLFRYYAEKNNLQWDVATRSWQTLRRIIITDNNGFTLLTLFVYDPHMNYTNEFCSGIDKYCSSVSLEKFLNSLDFIFECFSIIIEPRGASLLSSNTINEICEKLNRRPFFYTVVRDPLSRALSLYNYLVSERSKHEFTHNRLKSKTFEDYITSYEAEDSWLIRSLLSVPHNIILTEVHYNRAYNIMKRFFVGTTKNVDELIFSAFKEYFPSENTLPADRTAVSYNKTPKTDDITKLNQEALRKFNERTHLDLLLYNQLVETCSFNKKIKHEQLYYIAK